MGRYISNTNTNSYQGNELLLLKQGIAKNRREFVTAGTDTWTIDRNVIVRVRVWGGGGGGGGRFLGTFNGKVHYIPGAGGGAGGAAEVLLGLKAGTYNITVGAGGGAGTNSTGSASSPTAGTPGAVGGSSSFHTFITCSGGGGGAAASLQAQILGGNGGTVAYKWSGSNGPLYINGQFGGRGGSFKPGYYVRSNNDGAILGEYRFGYGSEEGAGESGGFMGYTYDNTLSAQVYFGGGGGGGYNAPFIYGSHMRAQGNSGRGVGTGGAGGPASGGTVWPGNPGAVVIEWN